MKQEKLLSNRRLSGELIWYVAKGGRKWLKSDKGVKFITNQIDHYLMRNQVYVHYKPNEWRSELPIQFSSSKKDIIKPDAIYLYNNNLYFLEVDNKQHMEENKQKIRKYKQLMETGILQKQHNQFPTIFYLTISEYRQKELRNLLGKMKSEVLLYTDIK